MLFSILNYIRNSNKERSVIMGWITRYSASHFKSSGKYGFVVDRKKECDDILTQSDNRWQMVLKSAMVGSTYYAALRVSSEKVIGVIILTCGRGKDGTLWGYKIMDESMGPCADRCPAGVLALLTPTSSLFAKEWRVRCQTNILNATKKRKYGALPIKAHQGVIVKDEKCRWIITNSKVKDLGYSGVKFTKSKWKTVENALLHFLGEYGTDDQRAEYAKSGQRCPSEWQ
jgi:hypothetical protein